MSQESQLSGKEDIFCTEYMHVNDSTGSQFSGKEGFCLWSAIINLPQSGLKREKGYAVGSIEFQQQEREPRSREIYVSDTYNISNNIEYI